MSTVRLSSNSTLASDMADIPVRAIVGMNAAVRENVDYGRDLAKALARAGAGPHGKHFHKRIHSEMTGPLVGEFGPDGTPKSEFVGVGFRNGTNRDLERAGDQTLIEAASDVRKLVDGLFW